MKARKVLAALVVTCAIGAGASVGTMPAGATCPVLHVGHYVGSWSDLAQPGLAGATDSTVSVSGSSLSGTLNFVTGTVLLLNGASINATVSCAAVTGTVGPVAFNGTIRPDGMGLDGTYSISPNFGTFSTGYVADPVTADNVTTLSTDPGTGATDSDPLQTTVSVPDPSTLTIETTSLDQNPAPTGYTLLNSVVQITAPPSTADAPLVFTFELAASSFAGTDPSQVQVMRNGVLIADCSGAPGTATPDPCIDSRTVLGNGNLRITALTSHASVWSFATPAAGVSGPHFYLGSASVLEGSGKTTMKVPVTLSEQPSGTVSVDYAVSGQSATAGVDFVAKHGTLKFASGLKGVPVTKFVVIPVIGDSIPEPDEGVFVTLSNPKGGAAIAVGNSINTILNDDNPGGPYVGVGDVHMYEGNSGGVRKIGIPIGISAGAVGTVTYTIAGSATSGSDFTPLPKTTGVLKFTTTSVSKTIMVSVIPDTTIEPNETVTVTLSNPSGLSLGRATGTLTIMNDD